MTMNGPCSRGGLGMLSGCLGFVWMVGMANAGTWQPVGLGDCSGRDVGGTRATVPEAAKCDAGFAGMTAICWTTGCTYKSVPTPSCTGGATPGQMYTCMPSPSETPRSQPQQPAARQPAPASTAAPMPAPAPSWQPVGLGDCSGRDVGGTVGPQPDPSKCNAGFAGQTAVCWMHGCTYKNVATSSCKGGSMPGQMYTCAAPAPQATAPVPAPSDLTWQAAGVGDCAGRDVAGSAGPNPDPSKCNTSAAGQTAVCWASGCTYKNVATAACKGGPNPGQMFTCGPSGRGARQGRGPAAGPDKVANEQPMVAAWQPVGVGDCPGRDVAGSSGQNPDPAKCTPAFAGQTAVCWAQGCTYKSVATAACTGGASPGQMYTCAVAAGPGRPKVTGKRYYVINHVADSQKPHEFVIDWRACKVAEISQEYEQGDEEISVQVCKPGSRLVVRTDFRASGTFIQYDWVVLDGGATLAGAYRDGAGVGPSIGKRSR